MERGVSWFSPVVSLPLMGIVNDPYGDVNDEAKNSLPLMGIVNRAVTKDATAGRGLITPHGDRERRAGDDEAP